MAYNCFDRSLRSPYGIKEPAVKPPVLQNKPNWMQSLFHWRNARFAGSDQLRGRDMEDRDTANVVAREPSDYMTKLRALQTGPQSGPQPFPIIEPSTDITMPWPVGTNAGTPTTATKRNYPGRGPDARRPIYEPLTHSYFGVKSKNDRRRQDLVPIGGVNGMRAIGSEDVVAAIPTDNGLGYGLDYGPTPWRVPVYRKAGLSLMAGPHQLSQQQQYSGVVGVGGRWGGSVLIAPPAWADRTRGTRGASGILQRVQGPGRSNVPAAYVPREVR